MHGLDPAAVYRLDDLPQWPHDGVSLAVLGFPVEHSLSPPMHNAALARMAQKDPRFLDWRYFKFAVDPTDLPEALPRFAAAGFVGLNLTVPHKVVALPLVDEIDPEAARMGAVNTLFRQGNRWHGFNSDGYGLDHALRETLQINLREQEIVLLGAGGASRAAAVQCLESGCRKLWLGNRTPERLEELTRRLREQGHRDRLETFLFSESPPFGEVDLVINATSLGLQPDDPLPYPVESFPSTAAVFDMIYQPAETALLRAAQERGMPTANGLAMLVHQGVRSLAIWTGAEIPVSAMATAAREALPR